MKYCLIFIGFSVTLTSKLAQGQPKPNGRENLLRRNFLPNFIKISAKLRPGSSAKENVTNRQTHRQTHRHTSKRTELIAILRKKIFFFRRMAISSVRLHVCLSVCLFVRFWCGDDPGRNFEDISMKCGRRLRLNIVSISLNFG